MKLYRNIPLWTVALLLPFCGVHSVCGAGPQTDQQQDDPLQIDPLQGELSQLDDPVRELEPLPVINKDLVGWKGASLSAGTDRLSETIRANWVMISKVDSIDGRVAVPGEFAIDGISVFLLRDGFPVGEAVTDSLGEFRFEGATPGPYAILCFSAETVVAFGFNAVEFSATAVGVPLTIHMRPVAGRDNNVLVSRFVRDYSPTVVFRSYGTYDIGEEATDPPEYYGWAGLKSLNMNTIPATTISARPVTLVNGRFVGRVHQIHNRSGRPVEVKNTQVHLIQDGQIVSDTTADNLGVFHFEGIEPGSYGLVATGVDGIAAVGIELVAGSASTTDEQQSNQDRFDVFRQASTTTRIMDGGQSASITLVDPESIGWINNYLEEQQYRLVMGEPLPGMTPPNFNPNLPYDYFSFAGSGGGGFGQLADWLIPIGILAAVASGSDSTGGLPLVSPFFP